MTNEEIRNEVLKRAKALKEKRAKRKKLICSCIPVSACLLIAISVLIGYTLQNNKLPVDTDSETSSGKIAISLFTAATKDPDVDAFEKDEYPHADVVIDGNKLYKQLEFNKYTEYSLKTELDESDFGKYIGCVVEVTGTNTKGIKVYSKDPALKNSLVYYYKHAKSDAVIIVKNEKKCSIFIFDQFVGEDNHSLADTYRIFGINSESNIDFLSYTIRGMCGAKYQVIDKGRVTNVSKIKAFYDVTAALTPNSDSATSDWLNDAYEEYRRNPDKYNKEDITVDIHLKNGLVIPSICYYPYIASGYVENMDKLSAEQNKVLRDVFCKDLGTK